MRYGQVWKHNGRDVFILGNCVEDDGTIWVADRRTGKSAHVHPSALSLVRTRTDTVAELTERCIGWARRGDADAAWWLGWYFEGEQHAKSVWYYVAAMRKAPEAFAWAWQRVYGDALDAYMCEGAPTPCIKFMHDVAEFNGRRSADWQEAIAKAESAVDEAVGWSHLDEAMTLLSDPDQAQAIALRVGIPYRTLSDYAPYQAWRDKAREALSQASV